MRSLERTPFGLEAGNPGKGGKIEDAWLRHAYDGYPREVWDESRFRKWRQVKSKEEYLSFLREQRNTSGPAHTSINVALGPVLSSRYARPWINKVLLELDGSGGRPDTAYQEMRRLYSHLRLKFDSEPRVYYSGHRSFHVFVDFTPLPLDNPVEAQRELAQRIAKKLDLKGLDLQVFGERKLSRIPQTLHEDTCCYCIPISPFWNLSEIRAESRRPDRFEPVRVTFGERVAKELRRIDVEISSKPKSEVTTNGSASTGWIEKLFQHPVSDGRHRLLWHVLAPYYVNVKKLPIEQSESELREYFSRCAELQRLSPSTSSFYRQIRYYLKLAERDGYPPWRLETIQKNDPQLYELVSKVHA